MGTYKGSHVAEAEDVRIRTLTHTDPILKAVIFRRFVSSILPKELTYMRDNARVKKPYVSAAVEPISTAIVFLRFIPGPHLHASFCLFITAGPNEVNSDITWALCLRFLPRCFVRKYERFAPVSLFFYLSSSPNIRTVADVVPWPRRVLSLPMHFSVPFPFFRILSFSCNLSHLHRLLCSQKLHRRCSRCCYPDPLDLYPSITVSFCFLESIFTGKY